jgi:hypothetical protein
MLIARDGVVTACALWKLEGRGLVEWGRCKPGHDGQVRENGLDKTAAEVVYQRLMTVEGLLNDREAGGIE